MKIIICSTIFSPNTGGSGVVARLLALEFWRKGEEITIVTETRGRDTYEWPFPIFRAPPLAKRLSLFREADAVLSVGLASKYILPALINGCPILARHPMLIEDKILNRIYLRLALNVAPSTTVLRSANGVGKWHLIPNPYDDRIFFDDVSRERRDVMFVGRLVHEKGADDCIAAFAIADLPFEARLHIVGQGPARTNLERLVSILNIGQRVIFHGGIDPEAVATLARGISVQVVPSRWEEPFGIVALESLASGCATVVAQSGGLPEAVGPYGIVFPAGDIGALAAAMGKAYKLPTSRTIGLASHLEAHRPSVVGEQYLNLLYSLIRKRSFVLAKGGK